MSLRDTLASFGNTFSGDQVEKTGPIGPLTIKSLVKKTFERDGEKEEKDAVAFVETKKVVVLNKTRAQQLYDLFGDMEHDEDISSKGFKVKLTFETVKVNNRPFPMTCIREA